MNLKAACSPSSEVIQESQSCQNSSIKVSAQYVNTVNTQYTFSSTPTTTTKKAK